MLRDLIVQNRSYRRFVQDYRVERQTLVELVDLARLSASGGNHQPLKYLLAWEPPRNAVIFSHLAWARYLTGWAGPADGERPAAYIVILGDRRISPTFGCDHGIAVQSILLGAVERGLGGCIIGSIQREALARALGIPDDLEILLVLALGKPGERVVLETVGEDGDIKYWRDAQGTHHVPKRSLADVIISQINPPR